VERWSDHLAFIIGQTRILSCDPILDSPRRSEFEGGAENEFIERNQLQKSEPNNDLVPDFNILILAKESKLEP
jgi:hypothetical protein